MSSQTHTIIQQWLTSQTIFKLESSPFLREGKHLFTFSPVQDIVDRYLTNNSDDKFYYKIQDCYRDSYPDNLVNPLSVSYQQLISLHCFSPDSKITLISTFIQSLLVEKLQLNIDKIYLIIPDIDRLNILFNDYQTISINRNRLTCKLPLEGKHYYIKIAYHYRGGLVTVANFVLVNYEEENHRFQLDSVIYPQRLAMIQNQGNALFETHDLFPIKTQLQQQNITALNLINFIIGTLFTLDKLYEYGCDKHKRAISTVKKTEKELFFQLAKNHISLADLADIFCYFPHLSFKQVLEKQQQYTQHTQQNIKRATKVIKNAHYLPLTEIKQIHSTFGLYPETVIQIAQALAIPYEPLPISRQTFAFYYESHRNNLVDPIREYR